MTSLRDNSKIVNKGDLNIFLLVTLYRDRSIPELDDILDAKLSEVQDHMRTLMQKQVRVCLLNDLFFDEVVVVGSYIVLRMWI